MLIEAWKRDGGLGLSYKEILLIKTAWKNLGALTRDQKGISKYTHELREEW